MPESTRGRIIRGMREVLIGDEVDEGRLPDLRFTNDDDVRRRGIYGLREKMLSRGLKCR